MSLFRILFIELGLGFFSFSNTYIYCISCLLKSAHNYAKFSSWLYFSNSTTELDLGQGFFCLK